MRLKGFQLNRSGLESRFLNQFVLHFPFLGFGFRHPGTVPGNTLMNGFGEGGFVFGNGSVVTIGL